MFSFVKTVILKLNPCDIRQIINYIKIERERLPVWNLDVPELLVKTKLVHKHHHSVENIKNKPNIR